MAISRVASTPALSAALNLKPATRRRIAALWREAKADSVAAPAAPAAQDAAKARARAKQLDGVKTAADFAALPPELQREGLTSGRWESTPYAPVSRQPSSAERTLARAMVAHVRAQMDLDVDPDQFATVGDPRFTVSMVHLPGGELVGGSVWALQPGVEVFDVSPTKLTHHFETMTEAKRAGAVVSDVNWSGSAVFDAKGTLLEVDPSLSWSGY